MFSSKRTLFYAGGMLLILVAAIFMATSQKAEPGKKGEEGAVAQKRPARTVPQRVSPASLADKGRRYFPELADPHWQKMAPGLTPGQAKELLEKDRQEEKNIDVRAERAWHIISQLCLNGYSREAWELIEQEPGAIREKGLGGFFRDANLPKEELIAMMGGLENRDRSSAFYNYWSRFTPEEFAKMDLGQFPMRNNVEFGSFRRTMEEMLAESYDPQNPDASKWVRHDLLSMVMKQANDGAINYNEFRNFLARDPSRDGFTFWEVMKSATPEIRANQLKGTANYDGVDAMVIRAMTVQDPEKAMAMTLVPDSHEANYIHIAMAQWLEKDFTNAAKWVGEHEASFTDNQRERAAVAFVRAQVARGEYESAAEWAAKITSPKWKGAVAWHEAEIQKNLEKAVPGN